MRNITVNKKYQKQSILLLRPKVQFASYIDYKDSLVPPVGLGFISESLKERNITHNILDLNFHNNSDIFCHLKRNENNLIGIQCQHISQIQEVNKLIKLLKNNCQCKIIVGGNTVSLLNKRIFEIINADYAALGDAEISFPNFINGSNIGDTILKRGKNKYFKQSYKDFIYNDNIDKWNDLIINDSLQINLNNISLPKYELFELEKYQPSRTMNEKVIFIQISRGCPLGCRFCTIPMTKGQHIRTFNKIKVIENIKYFYDKGIHRFNVTDDNILIRKNELIDILRISNDKLPGIVFSLINIGPSDDEILFENMEKYNVNSFSLSIEHISDKILCEYGKKYTSKKILKCLNILKKYNYRISINLLIGAINETFKDFEQNYSFAQELICHPKVTSVIFNNLQPIPGTPLYMYCLKNNYFTTTINENFDLLSPMIETPWFTRKERTNALEIAYNFMKQQGIMRENVY